MRWIGGLGAAFVGCTGPTEVPPPCDGGGWGAIASPEAAIHVRVDGDDAGDGSQDAPVASLDAAWSLAQPDGAPIAVGPGRFDAALALGEADGDFALQGCSAQETVLLGQTDGEPVLSFAGTPGATVTGVTLTEADRPLFVSGGAEVTASHVVIADARWSGFVVDGPYTVLELDDVSVERTSGVGGAGGFGGEVDGGTVRWTGGAAVSNVGAGLVAAGSTAVIELDGVRLEQTAPSDDGRFGRGLQVQDYARATLRGCTVADNHDAGVFALLAADLVVEDLTIDGTAAGPDAGGDGIVVTGIDADGRQLDPATFTAALSGNTVRGSDRAGIVLDRVTASVDGNAVDGAVAIVAQSGAVVTGSDAVVVLEEPLALERAPIAGVGRR